MYKGSVGVSPDLRAGCGCCVGCWLEELHEDSG